MELVLSDGKILDELARTEKTVWQKIKDFISKIIADIRKHYGELNQASKTAQVLKETVDSLDEIERLFTEGVREAGERTRTAGVETETRTEGEKVYSFTPADFEKPITLHDIEVLRSIGQKSINAFTSEDIEKAQKWAYKFYKEQRLGTKSPFFRAWFGDWRAYDTKTRKPYVAVNSAEITPKDVSRKSVRNQDTGWIIDVNRDGIDETANKNGKWSIAYHSLKNIQDMLADGVLVDTVAAHDPSKRMGTDAAFVHHLYCPVKVDGKKGIAKLYVVESYQDRKRFYLTKIEMVPSDSTGLNANSEYVPNSSEDTDISIAEIYEFVKEHHDDFEKK